MNGHGLMFGRMAVCGSSEPSQCHSMAVFGVPVCNVPIARYAIALPGSHGNGNSSSNHINSSSSRFEACRPVTTAIRALWLRMTNRWPFTHSASPHGTRSGGFDANAVRFASVATSACFFENHIDAMNDSAATMTPATAIQLAKPIRTILSEVTA